MKKVYAIPTPLEETEFSSWNHVFFRKHCFSYTERKMKRFA
jgi:hypothetical protein